MVAVKQPVQEGNQVSVGGSIVYGAGQNHAVHLGKKGGSVVYLVIKDAFAKGCAFSTGNAASDRLVSHLHGDDIHTCFPKNGLHFPEGEGGVSLRPGTSIDHQYFHNKLLSLLQQWGDDLCQIPGQLNRQLFLTDALFGNRTAGIQRPQKISFNVRQAPHIPQIGGALKVVV